MSYRRYAYQTLVTSLPSNVSPIEVWRDYNGRAGVENVIKELVYGFGLPKLCCKSFWATEAALSLEVLTYYLRVLFARHLGWLHKVTIGTLRFRLFSTAGILSHAQGTTHIKMGPFAKSPLVADHLGETPLRFSYLQCNCPITMKSARKSYANCIVTV